MEIFYSHKHNKSFSACHWQVNIQRKVGVLECLDNIWKGKHHMLPRALLEGKVGKCGEIRITLHFFPLFQNSQCA